MLKLHFVNRFLAFPTLKYINETQRFRDGGKASMKITYS